MSDKFIFHQRLGRVTIFKKEGSECRWRLVYFSDKTVMQRGENISSKSGENWIWISTDLYPHYIDAMHAATPDEVKAELLAFMIEHS